MPVAKWLGLAAAYRDAAMAVTQAVAKRDSMSMVDYAPLARVHERIRAAYGTSSSLLEVDAVLRGLELAFRHGSVDEALDALAMRCRRTTQEQKLEDALRALRPGS